MKVNKGWEYGSRWVFLKAFAPVLCLLMPCPAFFSCCTRVLEEDIPVADGQECVQTKARIAAVSDIKTLDVFIFDDGEPGYLDSYKKYKNIGENSLLLASRPGEKRIAVIANMDISSEITGKIFTMDDLRNLVCYLKNEDPDFPIMCGESFVCAGQENECRLSLTPLLSRISISKLECEFAGEWAGYTLQDVKAYLTNVSGTARLFQTTDFNPEQPINSGRFKESDLKGFLHPEMIGCAMRRNGWNGVRAKYEGCSLFCYPNDAADETAGSIFTRLVIEGTLGGKVTYYPIAINRYGYGEGGIMPNSSCNYSIRITSPGTDNPEDLLWQDPAASSGYAILHPSEFIETTSGEDVHIWCEVCPGNTPVTFCVEDLEDDRKDGKYTYDFDADGKGITLHTIRGSGMFTIDIGQPVNDSFLVIIYIHK